RLRLPAQPDDHTVGRPLRLRLDDGPTPAGLDWPVDPLRDDAVQAEVLEVVEPAGRRVRIARGRREVECRRLALEKRAALRLWLLPLRVALPDEHVERDEARGDLAGEAIDAALGGVEPGLHRVEVDGAVDRDHDLAVERRALRQELAERPQLREVA